MSGIHQILAGASHGDAITNAALELRGLLRRTGASEVYARHVEPSVAAEVRALDRYPKGPTGDLLVYHASIGEPNVHAFLLSRREPVVLVYHNVTPASYFARWDTVFAELLALGRSELVELQHRVVLSIADSEFNARELEAMGYGDVRVVPPVVHGSRLSAVSPCPSTVHHLEALGGSIALFVGQLLPHKRPDFLVNAMHIATTYLGLHSYLLLVGHHRLPSYAGVIAARVRELNLGRVHLVGSVADDDLAAMFQQAALFVTASEHEGFCVPLVEAMSFGLPVVARACGAVPETLGGAGLLVDPGDSEAVFAEAVAAVVHQPALRADLSARARARFRAFDGRKTAADMVAALLEVA
jgi:glycosyltransferase involved in cell wall biosynthesis